MDSVGADRIAAPGRRQERVAAGFEFGLSPGRQSDGTPNRVTVMPSPPFHPSHAWKTWLVLVLLCAGLSALLPGLRDPSWWAAMLGSTGLLPWLVLLVLQCAFALLMVPSLPLVLASALLFPDQPLQVLALALCGVLVSALLIRANAAMVGLHRVQGGRRLRQARAWIRRRGSAALCLWCMAPFLPSDLGCYVAAAARMPLSRYLPAVLLGESVLCGAVVWGVAGWIG